MLISCTKGQHPQQTKESNGKVSELVSVAWIWIGLLSYSIHKNIIELTEVLILYSSYCSRFCIFIQIIYSCWCSKAKKMLSDLSNLALPGQYFSLYCCELARNCMTPCLHYCLILFPRPTMLGVAGDNKSSQPLPPSSSGTPTGDLKRASVCPCLSAAWCLVVEGHCTCGLLFLQEVLKL